MGDRVAVKGEVTAEASTSPAPTGMSNVAGTWSAGEVSETSYPQLKVGGTEVIHQASCTFTWTGNNTETGAEAPDVTSEVTLVATTRILQGRGSFVLVDGNVGDDLHGNKLSVSAAGHLTTG